VQDSMKDWAARVTMCVLLALCLGPSLARADDLKYTGLDDATVRVFAFTGVEVERARSASGRSYVLAVPQVGHGTGLQVSRDGVILTAKHVVEGAAILAVQFPSEDRAVAARVAYADEDHDHAFLVVSGSHKSFVPIPARKPKLAVRQTVYVIGYPLDATRKRPQSQAGIVSGVLPDGSLQLGVALNPGNSGGPVVDAQERLIGIAVAGADPKAGAQGIGVAVPVEHILAGYAAAQKNLGGARQDLARDSKKLKADADLLSSILTDEDADTAWSVLAGRKGEGRSRKTLDELVDASLRAAGSPSADLLALAAANEWNAAAASVDRGEPHGGRLARAKALAERARGVDSRIVERSPFVAFALDDHEPTDVNAALPASRSGDGEGSSPDAAQMDLLLRSLETEKTIPKWRIGPTLGIITPFQLLGIGANVKLFFEDLVNVSARYQYGWHKPESGSATGSHFFEALGGIAIGTWRSRTTAKLIVDVEQAAWATVYRYVPGEVPSTHALIAELGMVSGLVNLQSTPTLAEPIARSFREQAVMLEGGLRYIYFYHANSDLLVRAARRNVEMSAHLVSPPLGVVDGNRNADGEDLSGLPGFKVDVAWDSILSLGQTQVGAGYFPSGRWIYFHLGWSYPLY
jgi:hypothetical protein